MSAFLCQFCYNEYGDKMNPFTMKLKRKSNYFEGYYIRVTDKNKSFNKAFIFGMTSNKKDPHAFMQIVDGDKGKTKYYRYDIGDFYFDKNTIHLPGITLSRDEMYIENNDFTIKGTLSNIIGLPKKFLSNSAMSFLHMFPMKTYQEIVIMNAEFNGVFTENNTEKNIQGISYMEKTYGHFFPRTWAWIQCNQFDKNVLLSSSIGDALIAGVKMKGYVISLIHNNKEYRFATYLKDRLKIIQEIDRVTINVSNRLHTLQIVAQSNNPITLVGPGLKGEMNMNVYESLTSTVEITLTDKNGLIVSSKGTDVGMENMYEN